MAYQINVAHTGSTSMAGFDGPLERKWSVDLGAPVSYPLAAQGKVFATTARTGNTGAYSALFALDAATGHTDWHVQYSSIFPQSTACYDNGKVFMFLNNFNHSRLLAYDAPTGTVLWNSHLVGQYSFSSPPTAGNGMVYLSGAGSGGDLYAMRQSDGGTAWRASVENGDVRWAPKTSYISIFNSAFGASKAADQFGRCDDGCIPPNILNRGFHDTTYQRWTANVQLPHGATITGFRSLFNDTGVRDLTIKLIRVTQSDGGQSLIADASSVGAPGDSFRNVTGLNTVVDNSSNFYRAQIEFPEGDLISGDIAFRGVRITYTVSEPS